MLIIFRKAERNQRLQIKIKSNSVNYILNIKTILTISNILK